MTVSVLDDYRSRLAGLPANQFIGSILWFTVSGEVDRSNGVRQVVPVRACHDDLEKWFTELDLDPRYLPPKIKRIDAFRTATSEASGYKYDLPDGTTAELLVREVDYNAEFVLRHVMREVRDAKNQKLSYDHVASLKFFRARHTKVGKNPITLEHYDARILTSGKANENLAHVEALIQRINDRFTDLAANLQSQALRGMIRNYVTGLNAIMVRPSGGVYFVHHSRQETLDHLQQLVARIGQGCAMHQIPLLDTPDQRTMLTSAFESEVEDEVRKLLVDIAEINDEASKKAAAGGKDGITARRYAEIHARYTEVVERSEEYTRVLALPQERAAVSLEMALDGVMDLATRIRS